MGDEPFMFDGMRMWMHGEERVVGVRGERRHRHRRRRLEPGDVGPEVEVGDGVDALVFDRRDVVCPRRLFLRAYIKFASFSFST